MRMTVEKRPYRAPRELFMWFWAYRIDEGPIVRRSDRELPHLWATVVEVDGFAPQISFHRRKELARKKLKKRLRILGREGVPAKIAEVLEVERLEIPESNRPLTVAEFHRMNEAIDLAAANRLARDLERGLDNLKEAKE